MKTERTYQSILSLIFKKDFQNARRSISQFEKDHADDVVSSACLKAYCCLEEGNRAQAFKELDDVINAGLDQYSRCSITRSSLAMRCGEFSVALADFDTILADQTPHIAGSFHQSARFHKCYILAEWGDLRFESEIEFVKPDKEVWIRGEMRNVENLRKIYSRRSSKRQVDE